MKFLITIIILLLSSSLSALDSPVFSDHCYEAGEPGFAGPCFYHETFVSMNGFRLSNGTGNRFWVDDTGWMGAEIAEIHQSLNVRNTNISEQAFSSLECDGPRLQPSWGGDYYVVDDGDCDLSFINGTELDIWNPITQEWQSQLRPGAKVTFRFTNKARLRNMAIWPIGSVGKMQLERGVDFSSDGPFSISFVVDQDQVLYETGRTLYY